MSPSTAGAVLGPGVLPLGTELASTLVMSEFSEPYDGAM